MASTRGEPLLWAGLPGLAAACAARGIRLNVTTNGSWPAPGAEGWARILCPVGLDVKVSWGAASPGLDRELLGGRDPAGPSLTSAPSSGSGTSSRPPARTAAA